MRKEALPGKSALFYIGLVPLLCGGGAWSDESLLGGWPERLAAVPFPRAGRIVYEAEFRWAARLSEAEIESEIARQVSRRLDFARVAWEVEQAPVIGRAETLLRYAEKIRRRHSELIYVDGGSIYTHRFRSTGRNLIPREFLAEKYGEVSIDKFNLDYDRLIVQDAEKVVTESRFRSREQASRLVEDRGKVGVPPLWCWHRSRIAKATANHLAFVRQTGTMPSPYGAEPAIVLEFGPSRGDIVFVEHIDPNIGDARTFTETLVHHPERDAEGEFKLMSRHELTDFQLTDGYWLPRQIKMLTWRKPTPRDAVREADDSSLYMIEEFEAADDWPAETFEMPPPHKGDTVQDFREGGVP